MRARRRRVLALGVGLLVVVTGISTVLAVRGIQRARFEERAAASRSLAVHALTQVDEDVRLAALLGLEAYAREPTAEARSAVLSAVPALEEYRRIGEPLAHGVGLQGVAISPDGRLLASATDDGTVWLWDVTTRRRLGRPLTGHSGLVNDVDFSPDGTLLASAGDDRTVRLWDVRTRRPSGRPLQGHAELVQTVDFSPDGTTLASGDSPTTLGASALGERLGTVRLWDVATHRALGRPLGLRTEGINDLDFSPDGALLAIGDSAGGQVWDVATRRPVERGLPRQTDVIAVAFSPDGKSLATGRWINGTVGCSTYPPVGAAGRSRAMRARAP